MNDIETYQAQLPDTIEDLTKFVLIGRAKLDAYKLKLQTVSKLTDAQSIRDQTMQDMQDVSIAIIAAEKRIGEIMLSIQKQSNNQYTIASSGQVEKAKTKTEMAKEQGYSKDQVSEYQRLAQNPEIVRKVIDEAVKNGEIVTRTQIIKKIRSAKEEGKKEAKEESRNDLERLTNEIKERQRQIDDGLKRIHDLEREIEGMEKTIPDDYESIKKERAAYKNEAEMAWKEQRKAAKSLLELKQKMRDLEEREGKDSLEAKVKKESEFFAIRVYKFIQDVGGSVWIPQYMDELSDQDRKNFIDAIYTLDAFSKQMIENIGGYGIE